MTTAITMEGAIPERRPEPRWRVLKFGGTSVSGAERLEVIERVVRERLETSRPCVVVSALAGVTNLLGRAATEATGGTHGEALAELRQRHLREVEPMARGDSDADRAVAELLREVERLLEGVRLVGECSQRTRDQVLSVGERIASALIAAGLRARGIPARAVDAARLVVTDSHHGEAEVDFQATQEATRSSLVWDGVIPVVTGFLGSTARGERTTLGRGGSDYSAAVLGWALDAEAVEIWTDVSGVMSADPRTVPGARRIRGLGFAELLELSHWGARVIHPKTVRPVRERGIPLYIRNSLVPEDPGTRVGPGADALGEGPVRGIASIPRVALVQLNGIGHGDSSLAARFLAALESARCKVLMVSQGSSERSVCVALAPESVEAARRVTQETFDLERRAGLLDDLVVEHDCSIIAVVGESMRDRPGVAGRVFSVLGDHGVNVRAIAQGSSELNISLVVRSDDVQTGVRAIHEAFFPLDAEPEGASASGHVMGVVAQEGEIDVADLAGRLIAIPSVSGHEHGITDYVSRLLSGRGWRVTHQEVAGGRSNLWATRSGGVVTLSTHLDTVPPHIPPRVGGGKLFGRGACDAKGIVAAMICAAERLAAEGEESVDLLFVVGEEASSDGARATRRLEPTSRWIVNGEPTESRLVSASKGSQRVVVTTHGTAAHSAYPELGSSAIDAMTRLLADLPAVELPDEELLGETTVNVGIIRGGTAANVVPSTCEAEIMIRLVGDAEPVKARLEAWARDRADLAWGSHVPSMRFHLLDGFDSTTVAYVSDIPFLTKWGTPLLFGPGSIHVAHTPGEYMDIEELRASVDAYVRIVRGLLVA